MPTASNPDDDLAMQIREFEPTDEERVLDLWRACDLTRPWNNPSKDVARKLRIGDRLFLVGVVDGVVSATVMAGYEGHRGWINYLAVDPSLQRQHLGTIIMREAERRLDDLGCPKINLQVRAANSDAVAFYESVGYVVDEVVSLGKRLQDDEHE